jgi:hypothetical protein
MYDAISYFNIGATTALKQFEELNIAIGKYTQQSCDMLNKGRIYAPEYKKIDSSKKRRVVLQCVYSKCSHLENTNQSDCRTKIEI